MAFLGFSLCGSCVLGFIILAIFHLSFGPERTKWVPVETKSNADRIYYFIDIHCAKEISDAVNGYDPLEPSLSRGFFSIWFNITKKFYEATFANIIRWIVKG